MLQGLVGKKTKQTHGFLENGIRVPLSLIVMRENLVAQVKTLDKDGYNAIQIAFDIKKKTNKALTGHSKKAGLTKMPRFLKEIRVEEVESFEPGKEILISDVFKPGDIVDVTGVSKGKGYAGVVKRHHFRGGPRTHGQSDRERAPGSIGQTTTPGRVYRGKKMAGRMGHEQVTIKNLEIIEITDDGVVFIKGLVPGPLNSIVTVKKVGENKKFVPLYREIKEGEVVEEEVKAEAGEALKSAQQLEESSDASTPASTEAADSGHGPDEHRDSSEDSSRVESPRASEEPISVEGEQASADAEVPAPIVETNSKEKSGEEVQGEEKKEEVK